MRKNIYERFKKGAVQRPLATILVAANILGTFFGLYYYLPQLSSTSPIFWPLIPDSPTATLLYAVSVSLIALNGFEKKKGIRNIFYSLAFVGNVKYGLWTAFVLLNFMNQFLALNSPLMYVFLVVSHLGMFLQAFIILPYIKADKTVLLAPIFYIFNDLIDYGFQVHTSLPEAQSLSSITAYVAIGLTFVSALLLLQKHKLDFPEYLKYRINEVKDEEKL